MPSRDWRFRIQDILECIGEAARNVPADIQQRHPALPWAEMRGIRNLLIHEYFGISTEIVWQTVQENLPSLQPQLQALLHQGNG